MNKILYTHIMGCAAALTVGACGEYAKAEYADANVVKLHWEATKDLFPKTFDDSFQRSDFYWLWSATFSQNFKHEKGNLYHIIKKSSEVNPYHTFHTADELQALPIDASLKKICKALGSRRFLAGILDDATVDTVRDKSVQPNRETTVTFEPYYDGETFFDSYGNGRLKMSVCQSQNGNDPGLYCSFDFVFKKEGENVFLTRYKVCYNVDPGYVSFRFLQKPQELSYDRFPLESPRQAGLKMNDIYQDLFGKKHELEFKNHSAVRINDDEPYKFDVDCFGPDFSDPWGIHWGNLEGITELREHTLYLREILSSEAFFEKIFGSEAWQIFEKYNRCYRDDHGFKINYTINPLKNGKDWKEKNPDQFEVYLRISDTICITKEPVAGYDYHFKSEDFTFIGFRFIFNIKENKISDVKFCDKLCLNGELIRKGEGDTKEVTWDLWE